MNCIYLSIVGVIDAFSKLSKSNRALLYIDDTIARIDKRQGQKFIGSTNSLNEN